MCIFFILLCFTIVCTVVTIEIFCLLVFCRLKIGRTFSGAKGGRSVVADIQLSPLQVGHHTSSLIIVMGIM